MSETAIFADAKQTIMKKLKTLEGKQIDVCYQIYKVITSIKGKEPELLRFFYENSEMIEVNHEEIAESIFSDEEEIKLESCYGTLVNGMLEVALKKKLAVDEFYRYLWNAIAENSMLGEEKEKAFAVYYIWLDMRVPYFELESGIQMENDVFAEVVKNWTVKSSQ